MVAQDAEALSRASEGVLTLTKAKGPCCSALNRASVIRGTWGGGDLFERAESELEAGTWPACFFLEPFRDAQGGPSA